MRMSLTQVLSIAYLQIMMKIVVLLAIKKKKKLIVFMILKTLNYQEKKNMEILQFFRILKSNH